MLAGHANSRTVGDTKACSTQTIRFAPPSLGPQDMLKHAQSPMDINQTVREQEAECTPAWAVTDDSDALVLEIYGKCHCHCTAMRTFKI